MNDNEIKRFGEITLLDIDTITEGGNIRICNGDDYINNIVVTIDEIKCISTLSDIFGYAFLETTYNKLTYRNGYFEIDSAFYNSMRFKIEDFQDFIKYINLEYRYGN